MPLTPNQQAVLDQLHNQFRNLQESARAGIRTDHWAAAKEDATDFQATVNQIVTFINAQPD